MRGILSAKRCEEIKQEVVYMFEEAGIHSYPIDCFEIATKLHYILRPYSTLSRDEKRKAYLTDPDGFSRVEENMTTGLFEYVIYYNDTKANKGRLRWTIFHEIGHIYLGHHDNQDESLSDIEEAEADFFAKNAIAPLPLVHELRCHCAKDIQEAFQTSTEASQNIYDYYNKWKLYGPYEYVDFEWALLRLFYVA